MVRGRLLVAAVEVLNHVHPGGYLSKRSEALAAVVEPGVVDQINKYLGRTRVRNCCLSESNRAFGVGLRHGIVLDVGVLPRFVDRRTAG